MKQRNVIAVICFSIITLGIYDLFWLVSTKKELNARTKQRIPSIWLLFIPILVFIATIIVDIAITAAQANSYSTSSVTTAIVAVVVGIVAIVATVIVPVYWFLKYCKAVHEYTNGELSTAVTFLLLWILRFVGIAVIQDKFNDMVAAGATVGAMPMNGMGNHPMAPQVPAATPSPMSNTMPVNPAVVSTPNPDPVQQPVALTQQPQMPQPQQPVVQPQSPVDPTRPESYGQQPPVQNQQDENSPVQQPPTPPVGPVVQ